MALIAESIRRSVGVTVGDLHLGVGLVMIEQLEGGRSRRAAKSIKKLNPLLSSRDDRALATAFPVIYVSFIKNANVAVFVSQSSYAREDAALYRTILEQLDAPTTVYDGAAPAAPGTRHASVTVATPEGFLPGPSHHAALIARMSAEATRRLSRRMPGIATLPDL
ncbi:MAG TPA: hypothetical protein VGP26_08055 [Actinophytocola sp.]|jgi:hypothetical protein|nr:hypothetical protein [Actinophytocola sp.]